MSLPDERSSRSEHSKYVFRNDLDGESAYQRHQRLTRFAVLYGTNSGQTDQSLATRRTDLDVLKDSHQFLRDESENESNLSYDETVALGYYRSLFKEFAMCDLKHFKSGNIALRWRTEDEVVSGAGQFTCCNVRCPYHDPDDLKSHRSRDLATLELPFGYTEQGETKSAFVKVVLCPRCRKKLTWKRDKDKLQGAVSKGPSKDGTTTTDESFGGPGDGGLARPLSSDQGSNKVRVQRERRERPMNSQANLKDRRSASPLPRH